MTVIDVSKECKAKLDELKDHPRSTYGDVVDSLIRRQKGISEFPEPDSKGKIGEIQSEEPTSYEQAVDTAKKIDKDLNKQRQPLTPE